VQYSILDSHDNESGMDYEKLCNDVLSLDTKLRFVGVCDNTGEIIYGGLREGIKTFLTDEEIKKANLI